MLIVEEKIAMRICSKCGEDKELEKDFTRKPTNPQGRNTICKACTHKQRLERDARLEFERNQFY